jgi:16S rRNA (adenine1518-N6/adenine1519-N6)-dimethyltransferase
MSEKVKKELQELGVTPSKGKGQNFLTDKNAVREILDFSELRGTDIVVEVGPGLGALTYELALRFPLLHLIEVEAEFAKKLKSELNVSVIEKDIRNVSLEENFERKISIISNVPYSISTEFCLWLFRESKLIDSASLLLQKEFALRLGASNGSRSYGSLSVLRAIYASAILGPVIPRSAFHPAPKVESQLIRLDFRSPEISLGDLEQSKFETFVRACFSQKRKTLSNSLTTLFESKSDATAFIAKNELKPTVRAEELNPSILLNLAKSYWEGR